MDRPALCRHSRGTSNPDGGEIVRGEDGEATGWLWERAMDGVYGVSLAHALLGKRHHLGDDVVEGTAELLPTGIRHDAE